MGDKRDSLQLEDSLSDIFDHDLTPTPFTQWFSPKRVKIQRIITLVATGALVGAAVLAGFLAVSVSGFRSADRTGIAAGGPAPEESPTPAERITPIVTVAEGVEAGTAWSLRAYSATGRDANTKGKALLCLEWKWGDSRGGDFNCVVSESHSSVGGAWSVFGDGTNSSPRNAFFGAIPSNTRSVTLTNAFGERTEGRIYTARELATEVTFFVGFTTALDDVVISGLSDDGREVWSRDVGYEHN